MKAIFIALFISSFCLAAHATEPIKALMICGGCCHDYEAQKIILSQGISARAKVVWTIKHESKDRSHLNSVYKKDDWAKGFDVVVHNECYGGIKDSKIIERIVKPHRDSKVPAVFLHCSAHSYRKAKNADEWQKVLGVTSVKHGPHHAIDIENLKPKHPVMKNFPKKWKTPKGELYTINKVWPSATPLAKGYRKDKKTDVCIWVNEIDGYRAFGTTLGHHNETMETKEYLDVVTRGLLWACGKLDKDGEPSEGYGVLSQKK